MTTLLIDHPDAATHDAHQETQLAAHLAARCAEAEREVERYLEAGRRAAAEAVLEARRQAATIVAEAEARAAAIDRRRAVVADSLAALHQVLGTVLVDLSADRVR